MIHGSIHNFNNARDVAALIDAITHTKRFLNVFMFVEMYVYLYALNTQTHTGPLTMISHKLLKKTQTQNPKQCL